MPLLFGSGCRECALGYLASRPSFRCAQYAKWHISLLAQCTRGDLETQHIERCRRNCTVASFREAGADHLGNRLI